jgi:hypothetical protein
MWYGLSICLPSLVLVYNPTMAGAGNTAFPILEANRNPKLEVIACDYSHRAVTLVKVSHFVIRDWLGFKGSRKTRPTMPDT